MLPNRCFSAVPKASPKQQPQVVDSLWISCRLIFVPEPHETVEKVSESDASGPYEDVLIGSFPLFYLALDSVIAFAQALVPSRATRSWRRGALRQEPHQPFQILGSRG